MIPHNFLAGQLGHLSMHSVVHVFGGCSCFRASAWSTEQSFHKRLWHRPGLTLLSARIVTLLLFWETGPEVDCKFKHTCELLLPVGSHAMRPDTCLSMPNFDRHTISDLKLPSIFQHGHCACNFDHRGFTLKLEEFFRKCNFDAQ